MGRAGTCQRGRRARWVAVEPEGAHRAPGRVSRPRVASSASRTRVVVGFRTPGWTSGSPLIGSRQVANPNRSGGGTTASVRPGTRLEECSGGGNRRSLAGAGAAWPAHPPCQTTPNPDARNGRRLANQMGSGRGGCGESDGFRRILCQVKQRPHGAVQVQAEPIGGVIPVVKLT